jgi:hypothetical protein
MAHIRLHLRETVASALPPVCMVCGHPAVTHVRRNFSWLPGALLASLFSCPPLTIVFAIYGFARSQQRAVETPLCGFHRRYWGWRSFWVYFPLLVVVAAILIEVILSINQVIGEEYAPALVLMSFVALIGWVVVAAVMRTAMIRAVEITETGIALRNVHYRFVDAVRHDRGEMKVEPAKEAAWDDYDPYPRPAS